MDKDRVQGTIDELVGSTKRQVGELTGNPFTEVEGTTLEIKGKIEKAIGELKDAGRNVRDRVLTAHESHEADEETKREERKAKLVHDHNLM